MTPLAWTLLAVAIWTGVTVAVALRATRRREAAPAPAETPDERCDRYLAELERHLAELERQGFEIPEEERQALRARMERNRRLETESRLDIPWPA